MVSVTAVLTYHCTESVVAGGSNLIDVWDAKLYVVSKRVWWWRSTEVFNGKIRFGGFGQNGILVADTWREPVNLLNKGVRYRGTYKLRIEVTEAFDRGSGKDETYSLESSEFRCDPNIGCRF